MGHGVGSAAVEPVRVSLSVTTEDQQLLARVAEQFARTAAGLALDGVQCFVVVGRDELEDGD